MFLDEPAGRTAAADRLKIKPIVVPRKLYRERDETWLEFFVVFSFQRASADPTGPQTVSDPSDALDVPGCLKEKWPAFIIDCLSGKNADFATDLLMVPKEGNPIPLPHGPIDVLTPPDLKAHDWDWNKSSTVTLANCHWEQIVSPSVEKPGTGPSNGPKIGSGLGAIYKDPTIGKVAPNPTAATDLRPGFRLESVDHRDLAEAFQTAEISVGRQAAAGAAAANQPDRIDDPMGIHLVLELGYYSQNKLNDFKAFLNNKKDRLSGEIVEFVDQIWNMYSRATDPTTLPSADGTLTIAPGPKFQLSSRDPKFNDLIRRQMRQNARFSDAVTRIADAYKEFTLQVGQTELRRHGRFIDSSRHRMPGGPSQHAGGQVTSNNGRSGIFRTASLLNDERAAELQPPACELLLGQVRQHPGMMRRLGLAIPCRVMLRVSNGKIPESFEGSAMLTFTPKHNATGGTTLPTDFLPAQTACEFNVGKIGPNYFRAEPKEATSFFGKTADANQNDTANWRQYHIFPKSLFSVSQDDLSVAAARARSGIATVVGQDEDHQARTRINSLTIYANPIDSQGGATSVAKALHNQLSQSGELHGMAEVAARRWFAQLEKRQCHFRLAAFEPDAAAAPLDIHYEPDLYAEQLMQGYTVFVRDLDRPNGKPGPWQSLCRRLVAAIALPTKPGTVATAPPCAKGLVLCCDEHELPDGHRLICCFEEEGFISTSVTTAARPYVGQACDVPSKANDFDLKVLAVNNKIAFRCRCRWNDQQAGMTPDPDLLPVISGIFRPRMTWDDFQSGDVAIVTPRGSAPGKDQRDESLEEIVVTELLVCPVFLTKQGFTPPNDNPNLDSDILLINATAIPDITRENKKPRGDELFPIVVTKYGTRFVDALGVKTTAEELSKAQPAVGTQFTVEGERRYYAQPWWPLNGQVETFLPLSVASGSQFPAAASQGILSSLGSAEILSYRHLDRDFDVCRSLSVPLTWLVPASGNSSRPANGPLGGDLPAGMLKTIGWLDTTPVTPKSGSLVSGDAPDQIVTTANLAAADAAARADGKPTMSPKLTLVRGFVTKVKCQIVANLDKVDVLKTISATTAGGNEVKFDFPAMPQSVVPDAKYYLVTVSGEMNKQLSFAGTPTISVTPMQQPGSEVPSITWTLTLQTTDNSTATVVYSDSALPTQFDSPAEQNRFIYPESALNYFVEAIGVAGPQNTVGRGLPQHPFSTFYNTGKNSFDLYFDDGTVQSLANVTTGGFDTRALRASVSKSADSPAAITIQPISELANTWGMLVAGELTAVTLSDSEMKLDITDLDQRVWTIHEAIATSKTVVLQPSSNSLPARRLADLEVGEYLLAACYTMKRDSNNSQQARHVRIAREDTALKASVCLLGKLEQQLDASAGLITVEGTDKYRVVTLNTPITKTDSQGVARPIARIKLWCDKITLQTAPQDTLVTLPALRVIYPETISVFAQPGPPDPGGISDLRSVPVHANVSEMITRWSGWSLTTPMPGRTDGDDSADSNPQSTLQFKNYRPDLTNPDCLTEEERERWKLPPLRFDRHYEICVRRVDLAGNHLYDEPLPPADALTQIQGYNVATSLYDDTVYMRARRAAKRQSAPKADIEGQPFTPATLAPPPLLGFPRARRSPAYAPPRKQAPIEPPATQSASSALGRAIMPARFRRGIHNNRAVPAQPTPSAPSTTVPIVVDDTSNYPIVAFDRDQTLYVLSDVLQILNPDTAEESARLLPPPAPVETVLLCGQLDKETVDKVVPIIRTHERYLDDRCNYHGIDPRGDLNYFGDWSAREFDVRLQSDSCETKLPLPRSKRDQRQLLSFFDDAWPKPRTINLLLVPGTRSYSPVRSGIPVDNYEISTTGPEKNASKITARVPPGVEAELQIVAKDQTGVWKSVQLMHATNGAWARPIWQALEETLSSPNTAPSTNRFLGGMMRLDVPSSGSFTIHAYWNDPGDQSVPTQYAPAEAIAHVKDGKVVNVEVVDAGFGFVTKAATLVESPARWPEIRPLVSDGKVIDFEILNAGEDCRYDLRYQMAPAQNGGSTKIEYAQVVARVNADGQVDRVELIGAIAGKNVPDACQMVPCVPRPPVLEAVCKDGKIDRVIVHDAGDGYEGDMRIRIIRQPPLVRIAEACVTERNEHGELCRIAVAQPGGWYASPPIVAAFDLDGDGCGAQLTAVLNSSGGVAEVKIVSRGLKYSHNVRIAFYTNQYQTPNQAIPAATPGERQDLCNIAFQHPIGDLRGRRVDYVVQLNSRFIKFLTTDPPSGPEDYWRSHRPLTLHVPRWSPPRQIELTSYIRPTKPDVAYLMPAFEWRVLGSDDLKIDEARGFFLTHGKKGRLRVLRQPMIRVYLHRPWHFSGLEQLGVVVMPAMLNTIRLPSDNAKLCAKDGGSVQFLDRPDDSKPRKLSLHQEPGYANEPLADYVLPKNVRKSVTRWGSDPVWNEAAFPPLTADNFTSRSPGVTYERIDLSEVAADPSAPQWSDHPAWLALHDVHYDGSKERWYADLRLEIRDPIRKSRAIPFVQLALVTYQAQGMSGQKISPVTQCDMYKMLGQRVLEVERSSRSQFKVRLSGEFDQLTTRSLFPQRRIVARLLVRSAGLPDEVVDWVSSADEGTVSAERGSAAGAAVETCRTSRLSTRCIDEFVLKRTRDGEGYVTDIDVGDMLESELPSGAGESMLTLTIEEFEIFPAVEAAGDTTGDGLEFIQGHSCARRLVYSYSLDIGNLYK